jgi:hypothetical protein
MHPGAIDMLKIAEGKPARNCQGMTRRCAIKAGFLGLSGLSLADMLRMQAAGAATRKDKAVILLWLDGGPSQLETYDPKPDAPAEYRGPWGAISTKVPGIHISESLPLHAPHADKMVFIRSLHHGTGDHFAGGHWMLTGRGGATGLDPEPRFPSFASIIAKVRGPNAPSLPAYVGLPAAQSIYKFPGYQGSAYLGPAYNPFDVDREQVYLGATYNVEISSPKWLKNLGGEAGQRVQGRRDLVSAFDSLRRDLDQRGTMNAMDRYQQQAIDMILGGKARAAFDLDKEDPKLADRYGRGPWGRYTLMARRLVEAGVTFCTVDMPHWDDHSNIKEGHGYKLPHVDRAVSALIEDLGQRGMLDRVLVIVMGEFGRTPKINNGQPGIPIPGRDHWGDAISVMLAGGGLRCGQVVGATNSKAERPVDRPLKPADLLATVYHVLGVDPTLSFKDHSGRPIPIIDEGQAIAEVI